MKKTLASLAVASVMISGSALATDFFDINPNAFGDALGNLGKNPFSASGLSGGYYENVLFNPSANPLQGTFDSSNLWLITGFEPAPQGIVGGTGLSTTYNLYALLNLTGSYNTTISGAGATTIFTMTGGGFNLYYDDIDILGTGLGNDFNTGNLIHTTSYALPGSPWINAGSADDLILASGTVKNGQGCLGADCAQGGSNQGSFGASTTVALTTDGEKFFTGPRPFFDITLSSGDFASFIVPTAAATVRVGPPDTNSGTMSITMAHAVPEPSTIALLGLGLTGLGLSLRRRKSA